MIGVEVQPVEVQSVVGREGLEGGVEDAEGLELALLLGGVGGELGADLGQLERGWVGSMGGWFGLVMR